jgi:hypothetical protein
MTKSWWWALGEALIAVIAYPLGAQRASVSSLKPGDRVQVTAPSRLAGDVDADFVRVNVDSLFLVIRGDGAAVVLARDEVTRLQRFRRRTSGTKKGLWSGAIAGAVVGIATMPGIPITGDTPLEQGLNGAASVVLSAAFGAIPGALLGGTMGALIRFNRWDSIDLSRRVGVAAPPRFAPAIGVRLTW